MKRTELNIETVSKKMKTYLGDKPNFFQLQHNTGVHRLVIKAIYTGERDYKASSLLKLCEELQIDLLK